MAQRVPGGGDLQQCQHQHVRAVFDWEAKELLDLLVLADLRQPQETLHQVQTFPARRKTSGGNMRRRRQSIELTLARARPSGDTLDNART